LLCGRRRRRSDSETFSFPEQYLEDTSLPTSRFSAKTLDPGSGVKATSQNGYQDYASSGRGATWPSGIQATESYWQVILLSLLVMFIFLFVYL
jgi:hypothetical protein